jgi:hypothetical protein
LASGVQAQAAGPTRVLKFVNGPTNAVGIGFDINGNTAAPIGSHLEFTLRLKNSGTQFGKPSGTIIGRVLIDCVVLAEPNPQTADGNCFGIAHVPDGFFTFEGNGPLANQKVQYYAITGGVGPYANVRGEIKNSGAGDVVTLYT